MNQERKVGAIRTAILTSAHVNVLPRLPEDVVHRFPSLAQWQSELTRAWDGMRQATERDRRELQSAIDGVAARLP